MIVHVETDSGSIYELDRARMTWCRLSKTVKSGAIRSEHGNLDRWPPIAVGDTLWLHGEPAVPGGSVLVRTSPVVRAYTVAA